MREQVLGSGKDVVLIAPFLGYNYWNKDKKIIEGDYSVTALRGAKWGERYLDEVLAALSSPGRPVRDVKNLVIACHSGGGAGMRDLVGTLGKYQSKAQGMLGIRLPVRREGRTRRRHVLVSVGVGTGRPSLVRFLRPEHDLAIGEAVLDGTGRATPEGNKADPPRPRSMTCT